MGKRSYSISEFSYFLQIYMSRALRAKFVGVVLGDVRSRLFYPRCIIAATAIGYGATSFLINYEYTDENGKQSLMRWNTKRRLAREMHHVDHRWDNVDEEVTLCTSEIHNFQIFLFS